MGVERIECDGQLIALIVRASFPAEGASFVTPKETSLQMGVLAHKAGTNIKAHVHNRVTRTVPDTEEVLHIEKGQVEVALFSHDGSKVTSTVLNECDTILLVSGGHGFKMLKDTRIIEVKQGPYSNTEQDKQRFETGGGDQPG